MRSSGATTARPPSSPSAPPQATLYAELGDLERAVALLSRSFMLANRVVDAPTALVGRLMLAQLLLRFDRAEQAEAVLARAGVAGVDDIGLRVVLGVTRAQSAALGGRAAEAERRLEAAFEEALAGGAPVADIWRETVAGLPSGSLRIGLLMLTGQVLEAGPPERGR